MGVDTGFRNQAVRMLKKCRVVSLVRITQAGYDTTTRQAILNENPMQVHCLMSPYSLKEVGKGGIEAGDMKASIAAKEAGDPAPTVGDAVDVDGVRWNVQNTDVMMGRVEPVMYVVQLRK